MPDWLRELQSEVGEESVSSSDRPAPADWLADLAASAEPAPAAPAPPQPFADPSWLTGLGEPPASLSLPGSPQEAGQGGTTSSRIRMPTGATDWLRSIGQDPDARSEPLSEPVSSFEESSGVPEWLRDLTDDEVARAIQDEAPDVSPRFDPGAPGWLVDDQSGPDASTVSANWLGKEPGPREREDQVPDWLQSAGGPADSGQPPRRDLAGSAEVPAWLRDLGEAARLAEEPAAEEEPAWLRGDEPPPPPPTQKAELPPWPQEVDVPAPPPVGGEEVPSWLREAEPAPPPPVGGEEVPSWLREAEPAPPLVPDDVPAWLSEGAAQAQPPEPTWLRSAIDDTRSPAVDRSDWLRGEAPAEPPPAPSAAGQPQPADDLPPWLVSEEGGGGATGGSWPADPGLPSWLRGVADEPPAAPSQGGPPAPPRRPAPLAEQGDSNSFLSGAELPSWLRIPEPERPPDSGEGQALDWLRRLGGPEDEDIVTAGAATVVALPQREQYQRTAEQVSAIGLLQRIAQAPYPKPATPVAPTSTARWRQPNLERVLYLLLALALLLALVFPMLTAPFQTTTPSAPGAAALGSLLDGLSSEDVVLVAYEWGAQRSSELRPLEAAITQRLIDSRARLILVSTDIQGTLLSFDLIGPLRAAGYNNENGVSLGGRDYVLLGYRPGGDLALRSLAQDLRGELRSDFEGQDATQGLVANNPDGTPRFTGIDDIGMILVMADQPQDVQAWMEQVRPAAGEVPFVFLLPQEAQPQAQPFLRLPNVYHVAGEQGALALQASDPAAVARATGQLWYSVAAFLLLLAFGAVAALVSGRGARGGAA